MVKRLLAGVTIAVLATFVAGSAAFAQSSGNFTASVLATQCTTASLSATTGGQLPPVNIKVSSGSGVALLVTPSLVTGLFGENKNASTTNVGIQVNLVLAPLDGQAPPTVSPASPVIYDQRIITISGSLFSQLSNCTDATPCLDFQETTFSAHSFNFIVTGLQSGSYTATLTYGNTPGQSSNVMSCVGPGTLTVTQVKNFSFDTQLNF
jgi:hypothetical protein